MLFLVVKTLCRRNTKGQFRNRKLKTNLPSCAIMKKKYCSINYPDIPRYGVWPPLLLCEFKLHSGDWICRYALGWLPYSRKAEGICFTLKTSSYDFSLTVAHGELVKKTDSQKLITLLSPISHGLFYFSHQPLPPSHHITFSSSESLEIVSSWHFLMNQLSVKGNWWERCFVFLMTLMVKFWPFWLHLNISSPNVANNLLAEDDHTEQ